MEYPISGYMNFKKGLYMPSFFKSLLFAALRPFRRFIGWQDLELLFIQTCALNLLDDPNPPKYEEFAENIGNQLSHSLLQQNRRVTKDQSATIFGSLNLICLHENLQRLFRELGSLMENEHWDKAETIYNEIKDNLSSFGFCFYPLPTVDEITNGVLQKHKGTSND